MCTWQHVVWRKHDWEGSGLEYFWFYYKSTTCSITYLPLFSAHPLLLCSPGTSWKQQYTGVGKREAASLLLWKLLSHVSGHGSGNHDPIHLLVLGRMNVWKSDKQLMALSLTTGVSSFSPISSFIMITHQGNLGRPPALQDNLIPLLFHAPDSNKTPLLW